MYELRAFQGIPNEAKMSVDHTVKAAVCVQQVVSKNDSKTTQNEWQNGTQRQGKMSQKESSFRLTVIYVIYKESIEPELHHALWYVRH